MPKKQKQSFLHGAIILMAATLIVKVIGALFKMPLKGIIGVSGFGYFNTAYGLFNTLYALSTAGLPIAVAKMVAECAASGHYRDIRRIHRISTAVFLVTGSVGTLVMLLGAGPYVSFAKNPSAYLSVVVMSPAILFVCLTSSFRGYYEGLRNMYPTGISQVVEALVKLVCGLALAAFAINMGMGEYARLGTVFGTAADSEESARLLALAYGSAGAILGIVISTFAGTLYLWLYHKIKGDGITRSQLVAAPPATDKKVLLRRLILIAVPVCLGAVATNVTTLIDVTSVTNRLATALDRGYDVMMSMYAGMIPEAMPLTEIPNYLFGAYNLSVTVFNLVPAITTTFGISALPAVTTAWVEGRRESLRKNIESVWRMTSLIAMPAGFGLIALAGPVLHFLFPGEPEAILIAAPILRVLGVAVIFVSLTLPTNSMLQAVGKLNVPVKMMLLGGAAKLILNFSLVAVPSINIRVAPYGTLLCYAIIFLVSAPILCRTAGVKIRAFQVFGKPLLGGVFCGAAAWAAYGLLARYLSEGRLTTLLAMAAGGAVYVVSLFLLRAIAKDDVLMLPKGEKIAKLLEKRGLIG